MSDLTHNIVVRPNLYMRLFLWFWDAYDARLNTCLMFWGTLGMVILWPVRLILAGFATVVRAIPSPDFAQIPNKIAEDFLAESKPSRGLRFLDKLSDLGGRFWFKFQTPITWVFRIAVGLSILLLAGLAIYGLSTVAWSWAVLLEILLFVGVILGATAVAIVFVIILDRRARSRKPRRHTFRRIYRSVHDHTCANVIIEK